MKALHYLGHLIIFCVLGVAVNGQATAYEQNWDAAATVPWTNAGSADGVLRQLDVKAVDEQLLIGLERQDECGQVQVFDVADVSTGSRQILSRADAGLDCDRVDYFGASIVRSADRLFIGAPSIETSVSAERVPGGEIFIYERHEADSRWVFTQRIDGDELGLLGIGHQLASDGERLFMLDHGQRITSPNVIRPPIASIVIQGVVVLSQDESGSWGIQSRLTPGPIEDFPFSRFSLAGDQLIFKVLDLNQDHDAVIVMQESDDGLADWQPIQRIDETEFSSNEVERNGLLIIGVSGDYMAVRTIRATELVEPASFPASEYELLIFRRDGSGQWQFVQVINAANTEDVLGPVIGSVAIRFLDLRISAFHLNGADLIAGWLPFDEVPGSAMPYRTVHYRLNEEGLFHPQQLIDVPMPNGSATPRYVLDDETLAVFNGFEAFELYRRDGGSSFVVNRGLSGGWWFGPLRNGQGVGLEILPNQRAQMVWVTHNDFGEQIWLFGGGDIDVDRIRFTLAQPVGGSLIDSANASVTQLPWGEVEIIFTSCESATLHYSSDVMGFGTIELLRLSKVEGLDCGDATASALAQRWTGSWSDPQRDAQGLMMHVISTRQGPRLSALWMTYHADGRQASLYSAAPLDSTDSALFDSVIRPTGPVFNLGDQTHILERNEWGSFGLFSPACGTARLDYVSVDSSFGSGQENLIRFSEPMGVRCF